MNKPMSAYNTKIKIIKGYYKGQSGTIMAAEGHNSGYEDYWYQYTVKLKSQFVCEIGEDSMELK